jgi:hypothetical protein
MAVGADWDQILDWIDLVFRLDCCQWDEVVNMNGSSSNFAVRLFEFDAAYLACGTIVLNASPSGLNIAFVCVYRGGSICTVSPV